MSNVLMRNTCSKQGTVVIVVAAAVALVAGCGGAQSVDGTGASAFSATSLAAACSAAAGEGTLEVSDATDVDVFKKEIAPFREKYPDVDVEFVQARPDDAVQRVLASAGAGREPSVDVLNMNLAKAAALLKRGLIASVDWKSLGLSAKTMLRVEGMDLLRTQRTVGGLSYNTKFVKAADLPTTWEGLIDPRWAGKMVVDPRGNIVGGLALAWGKQRALDWWKRLLRVDKPLVVEGQTAGLLKVGSGEVWIGTAQDDATIREQRANGLAVGIKYLDVVRASDQYLLLLKGGQHPNAAMCYAAWWAGPEGSAQQLKYEYKRNVARPEYVPSDSRLAPITGLRDAELQAEAENDASSLLLHK